MVNFSANDSFRLMKCKKSITFLWKKDDQSDAIVIADGLPKDVVVSFSGWVRGKYPNFNKMSLEEMGSHKEPSFITVVSLNKESLKTVFSWMVACCDGEGLKEYPVSNTTPFVKAHFDNLAASQFGVPASSTQVSQYMNDRLSSSLSVNEVKKLHDLNLYTAYQPINGLPTSELGILLGIAKENDPTFIAMVEYAGNLVFEEKVKKGRSQIATDIDNNKDNIQNNKKPARPLSDKYWPTRHDYADIFGKVVNNHIDHLKQVDSEQNTVHEKVRCTQY